MLVTLPSHAFDFNVVLSHASPAYSFNASLITSALLPVAVEVNVVLVAVIESVYSISEEPTISYFPSAAATFTPVTKLSRLDASAAFLDLSTYFVYCGARIPTKIARIATTITSSTNVKPLLSFFFLLNILTYYYLLKFISLR